MEISLRHGASPHPSMRGFMSSAISRAKAVVIEKKYAHTETLTMGFFNYLAHYVSLKQIFTSTICGLIGARSSGGNSAYIGK